MTDNPSNLRRLTILFWVTACALLFFRLGATTPWQSEDRWLEIAREMLASGNYLKPTINGHVYFDKPLLSYWLEIFASLFTGRIDEFSMRVPSALAALAALWATIDLGTRLWSRRTGMIAGWVLLTGIGFLQWGRMAEADMENLAVIILAFNWYWRRRDETDFVSYLGFFLLLAVGSQLKGLTAVVVPVLAVLPDMIMEGRWKRHLNAKAVIAGAIAAAIYVIPFLAASSYVPSRDDGGLVQVVHENIVRYFAPFDHKGPIYTYIKAIPLFLLPWSFVFLAALWQSRRAEFRRETGVRRILWAMALIFIFFTLSGSRRNYYILPILPFCALLCGYYLEQARDTALYRWSLRLGVAVMALVALVELAVPVAWPRLQHLAEGILPTSIRTTAILIGLAGIVVMVALSLWRRGRPERGLVTLTGGAVVLWGSFFFVQQLTVDSYRTEVPFARALAPMVAAHPDLQAAIYGHKPSGRLMYYSHLPIPVKRLGDSADIQRFVDSGPYPKLVVTFQRDEADLPASLRDRPADVIETRYPWEKKPGGKMRAWLLLKAPAETQPATNQEH